MKVRILVLSMLLLVASLGFLPRPVRAAPMWFNLSSTIEDTFVVETDPTASPGEFPDFHTAQDDSAFGRVRSLLKWNTSAIPDGLDVLVANLSVFLDINFDGGFGFSLGAYNNTDSWDELETSWDTKPPTAAEGDCGNGAMDYQDTVEESQFMEFDVTDGVFLDADNNGITLCYFEEFGLPGEWQDFRSSDYLANPSFQPRLWVLVDVEEVQPPTPGPGLNIQAVINYAWLLGFAAAIVLMMMGAWWVKEKRGG